jgi:hypothetical protein
MINQITQTSGTPIATKMEDILNGITQRLYHEPGCFTIVARLGDDLSIKDLEGIVSNRVQTSEQISTVDNLLMNSSSRFMHGTCKGNTFIYAKIRGPNCQDSSQ